MSNLTHNKIMEFIIDRIHAGNVEQNRFSDDFKTSKRELWNY